MDEEQRQKLEQWLKDKGVGNKCPACGAENEWTAGQLIAAPPVTEGRKVEMGGQQQAVTMAQVICKNCSHVRLFAAERIDIVK